MVFAIACATATVLFVGAYRIAGRMRITTAAGITVPSPFAGPNTLEELFAARYARGDIDRFEYRSRVDNLARQLRS